jgi:antitoxin MazE
VARWGNGLATRLPAAMVEALGLKKGDEIEIDIVDGDQFGVSRKPRREEILSSFQAFRLPADFRFDREEASAR